MPPVIVFDVETFVSPQLQYAEVQYVPRLVCLTYTDDAGEVRLTNRRDAVQLFVGWLRDARTICGHNVRFDLLALLRAAHEETGEDYTPQVFEAIKAGRVRDTQLREALLNIAGGGIPAAGLELGTLTKKHLGVDLGIEKKHKWSWRMRYSELAEVPLAQWPAAARDYAINDTYRTARIYEHQAERAEEAGLLVEDGSVQNERFQVAAAFWGALLCARGLTVDYEWACRMVEEYNEREELAAAELRRTVLDDGTEVAPLLRADGTMDTKVKQDLFREAFESIGATPLLTKGGAISCAQDALDFLVDNEADGPRFKHLAVYAQAQKFKSAYLAPILEAGSLGLALHHHLNPLVDSGRTSARKPNVQNFPARAKAKEKGRPINGPMIRGCFVPRPGFVFVAADYTAIELAGLAQAIANITGVIGNMAKVINDDLDAHIFVAAQMMGLTYDEAWADYVWGKDGVPELVLEGLDEITAAGRSAQHAQQLMRFKAVKLRRQFAKVVNYGAPGGCSPATLAVQAKQQGVLMSLQEAKDTLNFWGRVFPEVRRYFAYVRNLEDPRSGMYLCEQCGPGGTTTGWRRRLTDRYTSACNTFFQGLCADGAKAAGWLIAQACYADPQSPLHGSAMVLFVHDEFVLEVPEANAEAAAAELSRLMVQGMKKFLPDMLVKTEATIYRERWAK